MIGINCTARPTTPAPGWLARTRHVSGRDVKFLYHEIWCEDCYLQQGVRLRPGDEVIDVGANIGMFTLRAAEAVGPTGRVVALEPLPVTFEALQHNIGVHHADCADRGVACAPVTPLCMGVADGSASSAEFTLFPRAAGWSTMRKFESDAEIMDDMDVYLANALQAGSPALGPLLRAAGSLLSLAPALYRAVTRAAVLRMLGGKQRFNCPLTTVSEVIHNQGLQRVSLLKVDVERAELEVLRGVQPRDWPIIQQAALEVHAEHLPTALDVLRRSAGFSAVVAEQTGDLRGTSIHVVYCRRDGLV